jgi:hypothetical protein
MKIVAVIEAVLILILAYVSFNYYNTIVRLNSDISTAQASAKQANDSANVAKAELVNAYANITQMTSDISSYQAQVDSLNSQKASMQVSISSLQTNITILQGQVVTLTKKLQGTLPYSSPTGVNLKVINQDNTHNPTWDELKSFLASDSTDQLPYIAGSFVCGDFAQTLHNKAESTGIRCAIVIINFTDGSESHALNAFMTSDKGLVYIDDTGQTPTGITSCKYDGVGYPLVGQPYNSVDINFVTGLGYSDYISLKASFNKYQSDVTALNALEKKFENMPQTNASAAEVEATKNQIESEIKRLDAIRETLPKCWRGEMGIVSKIETFW